ncbi:hypothetical protein QUF75_15645 [Desulfococcaceae bacterium HSG7]|nr:hypothetical protein [Desulfococcaceae bacterium HSG9]MDM8556157.1 hypothetical protein [Desulfococcaceae bacterium HSG7]
MIEKDMIDVNVVLKITTASLQAIVENAKKMVGRNAKGHYRVDTADKVGEMISVFLLENDFETFVKDSDNYHKKV